MPSTLRNAGITQAKRFWLIGLLLLAMPLIFGVNSYGQDGAPIGSKDIHAIAPLSEGECFARWDPLFEGWWVLSPGTSPSCVSRDDGSVRCDSSDSLATLYAHEYLPGKWGYRCGPEVASGAGCIFIKPKDGEAFECTPHSGISLVCEGKKAAPQCTDAVRESAERQNRKPTTEEFAECERMPWINIFSLRDASTPLECSKVEGRDAECRSFVNNQKGSASATCDDNFGTGNCQHSVWPTDCHLEFSGALR